MEGKKKVRQSLENWLSTSKFAFVKVLLVGLVFVNLLGSLFSPGEQIYPIFNDIPDDMECPECRIFNDTSLRITERQFRVTYQVVTKLDLTASGAWRMLRAKIYGPHFEQEMRGTDNSGLYSLGQTHHALHFELNQEGETKGELLCLDQILKTEKAVVKQWKRPTNYTIVHERHELTNVCLRNDQVVIFTRSNVKNANAKSWVGKMTFERMQMPHYAVNGTKTVSAGFAFLMSSDELTKLTSKEIFHALEIAMIQSSYGHVITFKNANTVPGSVASLVKLVSSGRFAENKNICFNKLYYEPDHRKLASLGVADFQKLRNVIRDKVKPSSKIVVTQSPYTAKIKQALPDAVDLPSDPEQAVKSAAAAKAMIAFDDDNDVINGMWLSDNATIVVIVPPKRGVYSDSVKLLQKAQRKVVIVEGEAATATSNDTELLRKCLAGEFDVNSEKCAAGFAGIKFDVDVNKIVQYVK